LLALCDRLFFFFLDLEDFAPFADFKCAANAVNASISIQTPKREEPPIARSLVNFRRSFVCGDRKPMRDGPLVQDFVELNYGHSQGKDRWKIEWKMGPSAYRIVSPNRRLTRLQPSSCC